jgi:hypothetical protein
MLRYHALALGFFLATLVASVPAQALNRFANCDSLDDYLTDVVSTELSHNHIVGAEKCSVTTGRLQAALHRTEVLALGADRNPRADRGLERSIQLAAGELKDALVGFNALVVLVLPQVQNGERSALTDYYWEIASDLAELEGAVAGMGLEPLREELASAEVSADFFRARLAAGATSIRESCGGIPLPVDCD